MSTLKLLQNLRPFEKQLLQGYIRSCCNKYIPTVIIQLCTSYCYILDEFMCEYHNTLYYIDLDGINNAICNINTATVPSPNKLKIVGRNIISKCGKYHWQFKLIQNICYPNTIHTNFGFGLIINEQSSSIINLTHQLSVKEHNIDLYVDLDDHIMCVLVDMKLKTTQQLDNNSTHNKYRFAIQIDKNINSKIELISYHESNWYINKNNALSYEGYAKCMYDVEKKIKYYNNALSIFNLESWNNDLLLFLIAQKEFDIAYNHAMKYKKGKIAIQNLIEEVTYIAIVHTDKQTYDPQKRISNLINIWSPVINNQKDWESVENIFGAAYEYINSKAFLLQIVTQNDNLYSYFGFANFLNEISDKNAKKYYAITLKLCNKINIYEIQNYDIIIIIGKCYFELDNFIKSVEFYELYISKHCNSNSNKVLDCISEIAMMYEYDVKNYKYALEYYLKLGLQELDTRDLFENVADCYERLKDYLKALEYFELHYAKHSDDIDAAMYIALTYKSMQEMENADKYFQIGLNMDADKKHHLIHWNYGNFLRHSKVKQYLKAIEYFESALEIAMSEGDNEDKRDSYRGIADCYRLLNDDKKSQNGYECELECFLEMDEKEIDNLDLFVEIGDCYKRLKQYENAFKMYEKYQIKHEDSVDVIIKIAKVYEAMKDKDNANKYFNMGINMDNSYTNNDEYGNFLYFSIKNYGKALIYFERALVVANTNEQKIEKHKDIAYCYMELKNHKKSLEHFNLALSIKSTNNELYVYVYNGLGVCYNDMNNINKAIEYTNEALKLNSNKDTTLSNLGYFYLVSKEYELSEEYSRKAIEIKPNESLTYGNLGNCLYEMKKYDEAIPYLKMSLANKVDLKHPDVGPRCLNSYGNILYLKGEYEESVNLLEQLIKREEFNSKFENKDEIYYLMARNFKELRELDMAVEYVNKAIKINEENVDYMRFAEQIEK